MSSLREVIRSIRKRGNGPLACPRCGSPVRTSRTMLEGWIVPNRYLCATCGYAGFIAIEEDPSSSSGP